jgi:Mn2+/Fe2+ NRAMP family transporter
VKSILGLTLGIMTALGGFVDLGQIIFSMQAGALFGYSLLWVMIPGTIAIILYMEMCGRIAAVGHQSVFEVVRKRLGKRIGLAILVASNPLNLITCAAELCGIGIILRLLTGWNARFSMCAALVLLAVLIWVMKFQWIERTFGLAGLLMVVFAVSVFLIKPDWHAIGAGFLPKVVTGIWIAMILAASAIALTGIEPTTLMNISIIFGMVIMPLTYYAIVRGAGDKKILGKHAKNKFLNFAGWSMLAVITIAPLAAIPLMMVPSGGQP